MFFLCFGLGFFVNYMTAEDNNMLLLHIVTCNKWKMRKGEMSTNENKLCRSQ